MEKDLRGSVLYQEGEALMRAFRQPGTGQVSDAAEVSFSPDGAHIVFAGAILDRLEGGFPTRICVSDAQSGDLRVATFGPNTDRSPKVSPDGARVAFLSDRARGGEFQLYLLDLASGAAAPAPQPDGWVEYLHWSADGGRILLGVAGHGADISGGQGAITSAQASAGSAAWVPRVDSADESFRWRSLWVYELATNVVRRVSPANLNIWESCWCGPNAVAAVLSPKPGEGYWYTATLERIELATGKRATLHQPAQQLGCPSASPSGRHVAVIDAVCSDRLVVAGDLRLVDVESGKVDQIATRGIDITSTEWRSDTVLLLAGHRGFETVVATYDLGTAELTERWSSREISTAGFHAVVSGGGAVGDCALVGEGFRRAPEIAVVQNGRYRAVRSLGLAGTHGESWVADAEEVTWNARDGLEIQGYFLTPKNASAPHAVVTQVHGGPVGNHRPRWLGRSIPTSLLLKHGYAVFLPNPRGSSGRGQAFAGAVLGDCGGAEMHDHLSGLDHLVASGRADAQRLGVTGVSHGGYMTSWVITQDSRFAAAVPTSPVTNFVTEHLISNLPDFVRLFLRGSLTDPGSQYFTRSPIMFAHQVKTPTLHVCGLLDRCTPPEEAVQFHNALLENGATSVLVSYPEEGHGIRKMPAVFDYAARMVAWFERFMPAASQGSRS